MMFEAVTLVNYKDFKTFSLFQIYLKNRVILIIKIVILAFFALFFFFLLAAFCYVAFFTTIGLPILAILTILPVLLIPLFTVALTEVIRFTSIKKSYNSITVHAPIQYTFNDNHFSIYSTSANGTGNSNYSYEAIKEVFETKKYFYLYLINNQPYIIDKCSFTKGSAEQLSNFLPSILGSKFIKR